ncbi:MAG: cupin domain-containing protein [Acidimicrobiia bacterium]|nr:cupin domain-containing protein [Acidimicrobiia bacterium]
MGVRRVVTGHDEQGRAVFVSDADVDGFRPSINPASEFQRLWGGDETPRFPDDGVLPAHRTYFPPVGGFRFGTFTLPPADRGLPAGVDLAAGLAEFEEKLPGLSGFMEPDEPGMHATPTIDFEVVISGEVVLELDDGAEVQLRPGDTVVQNGTRHRWHNRGAEPATLAVFVVGAHHDRVAPVGDVTP